MFDAEICQLRLSFALVFCAFFPGCLCLTLCRLGIVQLLYRGLLFAFQLDDVSFERTDGLGIAIAPRSHGCVLCFGPFVHGYFRC